MSEIDLIREMLDEAAVFARQKYAARTGIQVRSKREANDLVTEVDLAIQEKVHKRINSAFPDDVIVAEEAGLDVLPKDRSCRAWFIDPIDGTQNFVRGLFPAYGVSIAFTVGGLPTAAGVAVPGNGELFLAEQGGGATRNGERIRVTSVSDVDHARIEVDFSVQADRPATLSRFGDLIKATGQVRCHCAAVIGICSIATGDMDGYVHVILNSWDFAAAMLIAQEAGGRASRLDGRALNLMDPRDGVMVSNGHIHDQMLALVV